MSCKKIIINQITKMKHLAIKSHKQNKTKTNDVALRYIKLPLFGKKSDGWKSLKKILSFTTFYSHSTANATKQLAATFRLMDLIVLFHAINLDNLKACI